MKSEYTNLIFLQHDHDVTASSSSSSSSAAAHNNWQILSTHPDGSEVALLEHPNDPYCPYVRMTSVMPGTVQDVWVSVLWGMNAHYILSFIPVTRDEIA